MNGNAKKLLAASLVLGLTGAGAAVFSAVLATASPFGGSDPPSSCGPGLDCSSDTFTGADATGPVFSCSSVADVCVDLGPGAHNNLCTNAGGDVLVGCGSTATLLKIGDSTLLQNGSLTLTNGAINADGSVLRNNAGGQSGTVHVDDPHGLMINSGTPITKRLRQVAFLNFGSIAAGATATLTATVTGAATGESVNVTPCATLEDDIGDLTAWVSAADTVTLRVRNFDAGAVDPADCQYAFEVRK